MSEALSPLLPIKESSSNKDSEKHNKNIEEYLKDIAKNIKDLNSEPEKRQKRNKEEDNFRKSFKNLFAMEKNRDREGKKNNVFNILKTNLKVLKQTAKETLKAIKDKTPGWVIGIINVLKTSFKMLKDMGKKTVAAIKANAGWITDLIGMLAMLAIFDPNGDFVTSIINFLSDAFIWIINMIAAYLPKLVETMIKLVPKIASAIYSAILKLADAFSGIFSGWAKKMPAGSFLRTLLDTLSWLFGKEGTIQKTFKALKEFFGLLFEGKIGEAFKGLFKNLIIIISELAVKLLDVIGSALSGIFNWIIDAVGGPNSSLGKVFGAIKDIFIGVVQFFKDIFGAITDLFSGKISFWQFIKKIGKALWNLLGTLIKAAWDFIKAIPGIIWDGLKAMGTIALDLGSILLDSLVDGLKSIGSFFYEWVIEPIVGFFKDAYREIKSIFSSNKRFTSDARKYNERIAKKLGVEDDEKTENILKEYSEILKDTGGNKETAIAKLKENIKSKEKDPVLASQLSALVDTLGSLDANQIKILQTDAGKFTSKEALDVLAKIAENTKAPPLPGVTAPTPGSTSTMDKSAKKKSG